MRKSYHLCLSSHDEVMCRSEEDLIMSFNCLAVAVLATESRILADGQMTTHFHAGVQTDSPTELVKRRRYSYTRYFNRKYSRSGRLAERVAFVSEIEGIRHLTAALSYIMRQGLHHGLTETPFGYTHCSSNVLFAKALGKQFPHREIAEKFRYKYLPEDVRIPLEFRMSSCGLLLREDIIDIGYAEEVFRTPQNFLYHMNRRSDDGWFEEQKKDDNGRPPVTLHTIEPFASSPEMEDMIRNEAGRVDRRRLTDIEMCKMIDCFYAPMIAKSDCDFFPVYMLKDSKRAEMANRIWSDLKKKGAYLPEPWNGLLSSRTFTIPQLSRCAVVKPAR